MNIIEFRYYIRDTKCPKKNIPMFWLFVLKKYSIISIYLSSKTNKTHNILLANTVPAANTLACMVHIYKFTTSMVYTFMGRHNS